MYGGQANAAWSDWKDSKLDTILQQPPISFTRSGYNYSEDGSIEFRGTFGYYWHSRTSTSGSAYILMFRITRLNPQNAYTKGLGFSLRCLVPLVFRQLPTYDGTKSYQNLLVGVYGIAWNSNWKEWNETHMDAPPQQKPISFIRSGWYSSGNIGRLSTDGYYWHLRANSDITVSISWFVSAALYPQGTNGKGYGHSLRCLSARNKPSPATPYLRWY